MVTILGLPEDLLLQVFSHYLSLECALQLLSTHPKLRKLGESKLLWICLLERTRRTEPLPFPDSQSLPALDISVLKHVAFRVARRIHNLARPQPCVLGPVKITLPVECGNVEYITRIPGTTFYVFRAQEGRVVLYDIERQTTVARVTSLLLDETGPYADILQLASQDVDETFTLALVLDSRKLRIRKIRVFTVHYQERPVSVEETFNAAVDSSFVCTSSLFLHDDVVGVVQMDRRTIDRGMSVVVDAFNMGTGSTARLTQAYGEVFSNTRTYVEDGHVYLFHQLNFPAMGFIGDIIDRRSLPYSSSAAANSADPEEYMDFVPFSAALPSPDARASSVFFEVSSPPADLTVTTAQLFHELNGALFPSVRLTVHTRIPETKSSFADMDVLIPYPEKQASDLEPHACFHRLALGADGSAVRCHVSRGCFILQYIARDPSSPSFSFSRSYEPSPGAGSGRRMRVRTMEVPWAVSVNAWTDSHGHEFVDMIWDAHVGRVVMVLRDGGLAVIPYA